MNYRNLVDTTAQCCYDMMQIERSKGVEDGREVAKRCAEYVSTIAESYGFDITSFNTDVLKSVDDITEIGYTDEEILVH